MIKEMNIATKVTIGGFILTLILIFASIVSANTRAEQMIEDNQVSIYDCKESINDIHNEVISLQLDLTAVQTHYIHIKDSLDRIEQKLEN